MIQSVLLENFGPLKSFFWDNISKINLLIGSNATGKTIILKALYTLIKSSEEFGRGDDPKRFEQILSEKIYWTFQVDKFNELITKGASGRLKMEMNAEHGKCEYSFGDKTTNTITEIKNSFKKRDDNSIFIPAKEIITLSKVILASREQMKAFGFDDTYYDLTKAIVNNPPQKGRNYTSFSNSRKKLEDIIKGKLEYEQDSGRWNFKKGKNIYSINIVSEGIKKIGLLDTLLGNRYLTPGSVLFIDEPESALHPEALNQFLDIITLLAKEGIQIFIASHSYFTIKKLFLIAKKEKMDIPIVSLSDADYLIENLIDGIPENPIIQESIRLYEEEIEVSFQ